LDEYEKIGTKITKVNEVKIPIVYFSSSGNTKYVAQLIKNGFKSANVEAELIPINSTKIQEFKPEENEVFGVGAPVYAMSFPPNMVAWVEKLSSAKNNTKFFLFNTNAGLPGPAIKNFKRILEKKKYRFIGALEIVSPTRDSVFELSSFKYND